MNTEWRTKPRMKKKKKNKGKKPPKTTAMNRNGTILCDEYCVGFFPSFYATAQQLFKTHFDFSV